MLSKLAAKNIYSKWPILKNDFCQVSEVVVAADPTLTLKEGTGLVPTGMYSCSLLCN